MLYRQQTSGWIGGVGLALWVLALTGCAQELTGPKPALAPGADADQITSPSFACNEQVTQWITLSGEQFSPLVVDSIARDEDISLELPTVTLDRRGTPEGEEGGDPVSVTLTEAATREESRVVWISDKEMRFQISPTLELAPGVYDVTVTNANDEAATQEGAFGILPRPTVAQIEPELTCVAQGMREVVITGDHFLLQAGMMPEVGIGEQSYAPEEVTGCRDLDAVFGGAQLCQTLRVIVPEADLEPGRHVVEVRNIEPAACKSASEEENIALVVVPPPEVEDILPEPLCSEQLDYNEVHVTGQGFIKVGEDQLPTVEIAGQVFTPTAAGGCEPVEGLAQMNAERCDDLTIQIPASGLASALMAGDRFAALTTRVTNPEPVGCTSVEDTTLTIVPPPTTQDVQPNPICTAQAARTVTVSGSYFLEEDGALPSATLDGQQFEATSISDCTDLDTVDAVTVRSCDSLTFELAQGSLSDGVHEITVGNPGTAACSSTQMTRVVAVPPPTLTGVVEDFGCLTGQSAAFIISGEGFIRAPMDALPTVTVGGVTASVSEARGCEAIMDAPGFERCTELAIELADGALVPGQHDVVVTNPGSTDCSSTEVLSLEIFPAPTVTQAQPNFFCDEDSDTTLTVTGQDFFTVNQVLPVVVIDGQEFTPTSATGCMPVDNKTQPLERCTGLEVVIPQSSLTGGALDVLVRNPEPMACTSEMGAGIYVVGPPEVTATVPGQVCSGGAFDGNVTLTGTNFLRVDGVAPTVTVNGQPVMGTLGNCTMVAEANQPTEACTEYALVVPPALREVDLTFRLENPAPADCGFTELVLPLEPTPEVTDVQPDRICDTGGSLTLTGQNFLPGMAVTLAGVMADMVTVSPDGMTATAVFNMPLPEGLYQDLTVTNPSTCSSTYGGEVRVTSGPRVFFVDPPVVYNGISTQVTVFIAGLYGGVVTDVSIRDSAGTVTPLQINFDPNKPNTVQAIVPQGVLPAMVTLDDYDVIVTDDIVCSGEAADILTVTDDLTVAIDEITPPFGWTQESTGVAVTAIDPAPANQVQFSATPRLYLNPVNPQPGDIATEFRSVLFNNALELNGIVDSGLPVGSYDVIVVNPDGSVGLLPAGFDVTQEPPPVVDTISPGSWVTNETAYAIQIDGANFRMPTVEATCLDPNGATDVATVSVTSSTSGTIQATVNTSTLDGLSTCVVRVTNTNDGTYVDYAPITITNPSGNFVDFRAGSTLQVARRGLAASNGAPTRTSRYIYAIGGDDGTLAAANTLTSVEAAQLDRFGAPGAWFTLPLDLPEGRSFAAATRVGDFVYLSGGHSGAEVATTIWRANVLDPLFVPDINNVDLDFDEAEVGIPQGVYYYRVSAVMSPTNAANPGGETLASDPQAVRAPGMGFNITISWDAVPDAVSYRIYRSAMADQPYGNEELLAEVNAPTLTFTDGPSNMITAGVTPLPVGSLGMWHSVGTMTSPRYKHGMTVVRDPANANQRVLVIAGGNNGTQTLNSIERVPITVNGLRDQAVGAAIADVQTLGVAREDIVLLTANPENANRLATEVIYFLGGTLANGMITRQVEVAEILVGGLLGLMSTTANMQRSRAGYAAAVANNNIVTAGGQNGGPSSTADKGEICEAGTCPPPAIDKWSSLSNVNMQDRYQMGFTSFGGFLYMYGGLTTGNTVTDTLDFSPLGGTP